MLTTIIILLIVNFLAVIRLHQRVYAVSNGIGRNDRKMYALMQTIAEDVKASKPKKPGF